MKSPYRLNRKRRKAIQRWQKRAPGLHVRFNVDVSKFTAAMEALQQSLDNLATSAVRFMTTDSVRVLYEEREG